MPGKPLTLAVACPGFSFVVEELAVALLRVQVGSGWFCSIIALLCVQCLAKHVYIETAGEGQHLPDLLRASDALQMPAPPLALLLAEELGEAPFAVSYTHLTLPTNREE